MINPSILVVDDEPMYCELLSDFFRKRYVDYGVQVLIAKSSKEAIELVKDRPINLLISDYHMPEMNGVELFHNIKKFNESMEVIFISGDKDIEIRLSKPGIFHVFIKPFISLSEMGIVSDKALNKSGVLVNNKKGEGSGSSGKKEILGNKLVKPEQNKSTKLDQKILINDFSHESRGYFTVLGGLMEVLDEATEITGDDEQVGLIKKVRGHLSKFSNYVDKFVEVLRAQNGQEKNISSCPTKVTPHAIKYEKEKNIETKYLKELMIEVTRLFSGVLFDYKLTVDINLVPETTVPNGKWQKIKLLIVSLISHLAKVVEDGHLVIFGSNKDGALVLNFEIYVTESTRELKQIVSFGCIDAVRITEEISGKISITQITTHQVNVDFQV